MTGVSLYLPASVLHDKPQELEFNKIATFIGGNGSGKSTILKSIFDEKLKGSKYEDFKVVCFSSGQNESYSEGFSDYLNAERAKKNALNLDCFYYDKLWSMLLIFLATTSKHQGLVRSFLKQNGYVAENEYEQDITTTLSFDVKIESAYTNLVKQAYNDESKGKTDVITSKAYHQTLHNFISKLIDEAYAFETPLEQKNVTLNQDMLSTVSFETDEHASFDSMVMFFTQAADNNYFIIKESFNLIFAKASEHDDHKLLRLEDLSDGEYQLLFLYSLVDLFDTENTLFLLDEADSHLHYKNIDNLWMAFNNLKGKVITTTHLLDSITKSGIDRLKVIDNGEVKEGKKLLYLIDRLKELSEMNSAQFQALSLFENVVLIDDENDWELFKLLVIKKLAASVEDEQNIKREFDSFIAVKQESSYQANTETFAKSKLNRLQAFADYLQGHAHNTKNVYLICDRDELQLPSIGTERCSLLVQGDNSIKKFNQDRLTSHLLSWKRREIKHYLLSATALNQEVGAINEDLDLGNRSKLIAGSSCDYKTDGAYNDRIASLKSEEVKEIVNPYINIDGQGFCIKKTKKYISRMQKEEISEDIETMYNYLVGRND
ncbi:MAG: ATP-binding protein [Acidiferrobacterales bacterium]|nr:ATP-binding protein [Acidiferrobacterales bacterium]